MAKRKRNYPRETPEERARFDETTRMVRERIAYHEAKARELDAVPRREPGSTAGSA